MIDVTGEIVLATVAPLTRAVAEAVGRGGPVVLDLQGCTQLTAEGAAGLVGMRRDAERIGVDLVVGHLRADLARLMARADRHQPSLAVTLDLDAHPAAPLVDDFRVEGELDGHRVVAQRTGGTLRVDRELGDRAVLLVALGETFTDPAVVGTVQASLTGAALAVALTHARACDRIVSITVGAVTVARAGRTPGSG